MSNLLKIKAAVKKMVAERRQAQLELGINPSIHPTSLREVQEMNRCAQMHESYVPGIRRAIKFEVNS